MINLPAGIASLSAARRALRKRWMSTLGERGTVDWKPDVVDVRAVDIEKAEDFARDVARLINCARRMRGAATTVSQQAVFGQDLTEQLIQLELVYYPAQQETST